VAVSADSPVAPETELYRRIPPVLDIALVRDENRQCVRLSSSIFNTERMSVVVEDTLKAEGRDPLDVLRNHPEDFLVSITAGLAMEHGQTIERCPEEDEPAHAEVVGKMTKGKARAFSRAVKWVKKPENLCSEDEN
jgi:hypothetical protein